jgi:hypothetical protein
MRQRIDKQKAKDLSKIPQSPTETMIRAFDPLGDPAWDCLLRSSGEASVFHTSEWLTALRRTYGYEPVAFSADANRDELSSGIVFCRVNSWLTGSRLVSLPFSDHCQPLGRPEQIHDVLEFLARERGPRKLKYVECRPLTGEWFEGKAESGFGPSSRFCFHQIDLTASTEQLFRKFHKDCIQRKTRKAEREGLRYEKGRGPEILGDFYKLMLRTRQRHGLPPQPRSWFKNLAECMGDALAIRVVKKSDTAIASILTLSFKETVVYKYGCSDSHFNNLGGMPFLFWQLIQEAKTEGRKVLDLGRSDLDNLGLIAFKDHLGAKKSIVKYYRNSSQPNSALAGWKEKIGAEVFRRMPAPCLSIAGRLLYKHIG